MGFIMDNITDIIKVPGWRKLESTGDFCKMAQDCCRKPFQQNALPIRDQSKQLECSSRYTKQNKKPSTKHQRKNEKQKGVGFQDRIRSHNLFIIHQPKMHLDARSKGHCHYCIGSATVAVFKKQTAGRRHQPPVPDRKAWIALCAQKGCSSGSQAPNSIRYLAPLGIFQKTGPFPVVRMVVQDKGYKVVVIV